MVSADLVRLGMFALALSARAHTGGICVALGCTSSHVHDNQRCDARSCTQQANDIVKDTRKLYFRRSVPNHQHLHRHHHGGGCMKACFPGFWGATRRHTVMSML